LKTCPSTCTSQILPERVRAVIFMEKGSKTELPNFPN
jgi:hypothetical protein